VYLRHGVLLKFEALGCWDARGIDSQEENNRTKRQGKLRRQ